MSVYRANKVMCSECCQRRRLVFGALLPILMLLPWGVVHAQEDAVELQARPDLRALRDGDGQAGARFGVRREPANPFKAASGKHSGREAASAGKLPPAIGRLLKSRKAASLEAPSIKSPYSKLRGAGAWARQAPGTSRR